jgi:hypothetical protein
MGKINCELEAVPFTIVELPVQLAARISHPHVTFIYGMGEHLGQRSIAMNSCPARPSGVAMATVLVTQVLVIGLIWSVRNPHRGLQDLVSRTRLMMTS